MSLSSLPPVSADSPPPFPALLPRISHPRFFFPSPLVSSSLSPLLWVQAISTLLSPFASGGFLSPHSPGLSPILRREPVAGGGSVSVSSSFLHPPPPGAGGYSSPGVGQHREQLRGQQVRQRMVWSKGHYMERSIKGAHFRTLGDALQLPRHRGHHQGGESWGLGPLSRGQV